MLLQRLSCAHSPTDNSSLTSYSKSMWKPSLWGMLVEDDGTRSDSWLRCSHEWIVMIYIISINKYRIWFLHQHLRGLLPYHVDTVLIPNFLRQISSLSLKERSWTTEGGQVPFQRDQFWSGREKSQGGMENLHWHILALFSKLSEKVEQLNPCFFGALTFY